MVSVVTPVYNAEPYLAGCIESVLSQSYTNYEYIIADNRSTDGSLDIARSYARKDARIRVIGYDVFVDHIQNHNRALGLMSDESAYCKIVQADDSIFPECLSKMVALAESEPSVGIVSSYGIFGTEVHNLGLPFPRRVLSGREACRLHLIDGVSFFGTPTTILVRGDIARRRSPFFCEGSYDPDSDACYEILQYSDFAFVHEVLSFVRRDNESVTSARRRFNPGLLSAFAALHKYGGAYLDRDEHARRYKRLKDEYFGFLGREYLQNRDPGFWAYHRQGLDHIGYPLRKRELARYALRRIFG